MTCGIKKIGLWAKVNRRWLVLARDHRGTFTQFSRHFSSSGSDFGGNSNGNDSQPQTKGKKHPIKDIPDEEIKKSVFISQSHDIFTNLALEDWLYRNSDFTKHHVLMLWANDPCVVVGRHQNP